jgi:hypothetical protein
MIGELVITRKETVEVMFTWKDKEKLRKTSIKIVGLVTKIWTWQPPNTKYE